MGNVCDVGKEKRDQYCVLVQLIIMIVWTSLVVISVA